MMRDKIKMRALKFASAFSNHPYVKAINGAAAKIMPILLLGGLIVLLSSIFENISSLNRTSLLINKFLMIQNWIVDHNYIFLDLFTVTIGIIALFLAGAVAYFLAGIYQEKDKRINPFFSFNLAIIVFLMTAIRSMNETLSIDYLGFRGFFPSIVIGIITVEITKFLFNRNLTIKVSTSINKDALKFVDYLIPVLVNFALFLIINAVALNVFDRTIVEALYHLFVPILSRTDTAVFVILIMLLSQSLWLLGVHGGSVTGVITSLVYTSNLVSNASAKIMNQPLQFIMTNALSVHIVVMGGAGASLGLAFLLRRSKSDELRAVGKAGFTSSIFGINEPILYGTPLVGNKYFRIPFLIVPSINVFIAYYATKAGMIAKSFVFLPWTTPAIIGLPLATLDFRALYLVMFVFMVDVLVYYPFFKKYESNVLKETNN